MSFRLLAYPLVLGIALTEGLTLRSKLRPNLPRDGHKYTSPLYQLMVIGRWYP